ncbi:hypothetical protein HAX54_003026 [Datura stramonium]|uniref:Uncharacterized protein n=1 Tax=Datura stramonium TaxID=4076 RepID=A0ABS8WRU9_DATST|nr:hypothetical protein [Datura stramonium]
MPKNGFVITYHISSKLGSVVVDDSLKLFVGDIVEWRQNGVGAAGDCLAGEDEEGDDVSRVGGGRVFAVVASGPLEERGKERERRNWSLHRYAGRRGGRRWSRIYPRVADSDTLVMNHIGFK